MWTRRTVLVLVLIAICAGAFLAGRASVSRVGVPVETTLATSKVANGFDPVSVNFVSPDAGWALGTVPCATGRSCLSLLQTINAGRSWSAKALPAPLLNAAGRKVLGFPALLYGDAGLNVRFANERDGWIYGSLPGPVSKLGTTSVSYIEPVLWSTHDGGLVWSRQSLSVVNKYGPIFDLEASAGTVYLVAQSRGDGVTVESSPVGKDDWRVSNVARLYLPAGGAEPVAAIVLEGKSGWLVVGNDRGVSASVQLNGDGRWVSWAPPCESVGDSYSVPAFSTTRILFAECAMGGFASPLSSAAPRGATLGSTWLYVSHNAGRTFTAGPELGRANVSFEWILASPKPSEILIARNFSPHEQLLASFDGGRHWTVVYSGNVSFLHFVSPTGAVALVQSAKGRNQLIMTSDGGHDWFPISF